jgi:hypothetical protein
MGAEFLGDMENMYCQGASDYFSGMPKKNLYEFMSNIGNLDEMIINLHETIFTTLISSLYGAYCDGYASYKSNS